MRQILLLAAFAVLSLGPARAQDAAEPVRPVKTITVEAGDATLRRTFFGNVVARQTVALAFQVGGQIEEFPVLEGDPIEKGAMIAQLDLEPFRLALERAQIQLAQAEREFARLEQLSTSTVSQATKDDARSAVDLATVAVKDAEYALEQATLAAPFDGLVASREVANFTTVQAGTPVVRIHDISEWQVEIGVPEVLFRLAGENPRLEFFGTFSGSDRRIPLELREFKAEASTVGQTFTITLAMLEDPGPGVLPGSSITVEAALETEDPEIAVPASAVVVGDDGETSVMLFEAGENGQGVARRVPVALSTAPDGDFLAESGLSPGDELIVAGAKALRDGQTVRRFTGFGN